MKKNTIKKIAYLSTFLIAGITLFSSLSISNFTKEALPVSADAINIYLKGSMNDWTSNEKYRLKQIGTSNEYAWTGELEKNAEFKIHRQDNDQWKGFNKLHSDVQGDYNGSGDSNIKSKADGYITMTYHAIDDYINVRLANIVQLPKTGIDKNSMRVWLHRGAFEDAGAANMLQFGTVVNNYSTIYEASGYASFIGSEWVAYFDIPTSDLTPGMVVRVARINPGRTRIWNTTKTFTWQQGDNSKMLYVGNLPANWDDTTLSSGIVADDKQIPVSFLKYVLEGYLTCSSSVVNGYGAFNQMNYSFFVKADGSWKTDGSLGSISITDYASGDTNYSGNKTYTITGWDKYSKMKSMYESGGAGATTIIPPNDSSSSNTTAAIIISVLFSITIIGGLYFVKRKKQLA